MWIIFVLNITGGIFTYSMVPDLGYETQAQCQAHVDRIRKQYPEDYLDNTLAVCMKDGAAVPGKKIIIKPKSKVTS